MNTPAEMAPTTRGSQLVLVLALLFLAAQQASAQVSSIITQDIFNQFLPSLSTSGCPGNGFYSYDAFTESASAFSGFGTSSADQSVNARELAAFFAHVAHETGEGCYIEEQNPPEDYCDPTTVSCAQGQSYYGRGPLQLTWNYNYNAAGQYLNFDGINDPGVVATDPVLSCKTAAWFWMVNSNCHSDIVDNQDFGATIRDINSQECGGTSSEAQDRINLYQQYCSILGVDPGSSLNC